jgi:FkbM family methyltransferase
MLLGGALRNMNKYIFYNQLKNINIDPEVIIDCGAACGEWSSNIRSIFPKAKIIGIDANDWCKGKISGTDITEIQVLSDKDDEEITFYRKKETFENGTFCTGDSIYKELSQHYQTHNTFEVKTKTKTLSSILNKHNINKVDILKIDTQGSELIIMKGLGELLQSVKFIELECSVMEYNQGGCKFHEIVEFLKDNFSLFDIVEMTRTSVSTYDINKKATNGDFLFQMDIIFKNNSVII